MSGPWLQRWAGHLGLIAPDQPLFQHMAGSGDPLQQIDWLHAYGFAGVADLWLAQRSLEQQATIGRRVAEHGMAFGSLVHPPTDWSDAAFETTLAAAQRARAASIACIALADATLPHAAQLERFGADLRRCAERASAAGVLLCVEAVDPERFGGLLVTRLEQAMSVIAQVGHPSVRLVFDTGHVAAEGLDVVDAFRSCRPSIGCVQCADAPGRIDLGAGRLDWSAFLDAVQASGYTGLLEIEHLPMEPGQAGERALLARLRAVDRSTIRNSRMG